MKDEEIAEKVNNFFANPQLTSTYKLVLFKAILNWCQEKEASDTQLLSLDSIAEYFIRTYTHYYQNKELHHLTNKQKRIEFFNLLEESKIKDNQDISDSTIDLLKDDAKKIILQDVIYRFRNNCCIYDYIQYKNNTIEKIVVSNNVTEKEFNRIRKKITFLIFDSDTILWIRNNFVLINNALSYLLYNFLFNVNKEQSINYELILKFYNL